MISMASLGSKRRLRRLASDSGLGLGVRRGTMTVAAGSVPGARRPGHSPASLPQSRKRQRGSMESCRSGAAPSHTRERAGRRANHPFCQPALRRQWAIRGGTRALPQSAIRWLLVDPASSHMLVSRYLVDPASSHMLVSKIKPCMSKYKLLYTVKLRMAH